MWPFKNDNQDNQDSVPSMPPELNDYYQTEKRQQTATTWVLGFLTLLVTAALVFGLFLGGRWVVNKFKGDKPADTPTVQTDGDVNTSGVPNTASGGDTSVETPTTEEETTNEPTADESGRTSSATTELPSTGPTETIAVFMSVTVLAAFAHRYATKQS